MSSINSIGNTSSMMQGMQARRRPDPAEMAENLFSKLDTSSQGYLEKADLQAAFDNISTSTDSSTSTSGTTSGTTSADALFEQLDTDSDGKVTKQEFSDTLKKLSEQLDQQFMSLRMQGGAGEAGGMGGGMSGMNGMGGMPPPPPPPENDTGFTKDELSSQLEEIGNTDSQRASLISSVIENFDTADTNSDGKVSFSEAMALEQSDSTSATSTSASSSTSSTSSSTGTTTASSALDDKVMLQIMRLVHAYGAHGESGSSASAQISATA